MFRRLVETLVPPAHTHLTKTKQCSRRFRSVAKELVQRCLKKTEYRRLKIFYAILGEKSRVWGGQLREPYLARARASRGLITSARRRVRPCSRFRQR